MKKIAHFTSFLTVLLMIQSATSQETSKPLEPKIAVVQTVEGQDAKADNRYYVGIVTREVPTVLKKQLPILKKSGVLVERVIEKSPAAKAGVKADDIIVCIDCDEGIKPVVSPESLIELISNSKSPDFTLTIIREGDEQEIKVKAEKSEVAAKNMLNNQQPFSATSSIDLSNKCLNSLKENLLKIEGMTEDQQMAIKQQIEKAREQLKTELANQPLPAPVMGFGNPLVLTFDANMPAGHNPMMNGIPNNMINLNTQNSFTSSQSSSANGVTVEMTRTFNNGQEKSTLKVTRSNGKNNEPETWNITADEINKLPKDLQGQVKKMLQNMNNQPAKIHGNNLPFAPGFPGMPGNQGVFIQKFSNGTVHGEAGGFATGSAGGTAGGSATSSANGQAGGSSQGNSGGQSGGTSTGNSNGTFNMNGVSTAIPNANAFTTYTMPYIPGNNQQDAEMIKKLDQIIDRLNKLEEKVNSQKK